MAMATAACAASAWARPPAASASRPAGIPVEAKAGGYATAPEARLIEVYRRLRAGDLNGALTKAETLTRDVPNFQLAQLVYGDLLLARLGRLGQFGDVPAAVSANATSPDQLPQLRREALVRLAALAERPPEGALPKEFIAIPPSTRHAIAVDASRSRLYLFENGPDGLKLVEDHYVSVGRLGVGKKEQGDQRTPLGVYFVTSRLDAAQLQNFYGAGALPLNYPNEYDRRLGKTGNGIWLHGVPPQNFARSPQSTDGCVVLANEDMNQLLRKVEPRTTPVVISSRLEWTSPEQAEPARTAVRHLIEQWRQARARGDATALLAFYSRQFSSGSQDYTRWSRSLTAELRAERGRESELKDVSVLASREGGEVLIITFGLVPRGQRTGPIKRQYWGKEGGQWKIFFEGVIG